MPNLIINAKTYYENIDFVDNDFKSKMLSIYDSDGDSEINVHEAAQKYQSYIASQLNQNATATYPNSDIHSQFYQDTNLVDATDFKYFTDTYLSGSGEAWKNEYTGLFQDCVNLSAITIPA